MSKTARPAHASLPSDVPPRRRPVTLVTSDRPRIVSLHFKLATVYMSLTVAKCCISRHGRHTYNPNAAVTAEGPHTPISIISLSLFPSYYMKLEETVSRRTRSNQRIT
eukprot:105059-Prymnesium_polylepis.1